MSVKLIFLGFILLITNTVFANTYYIDYSSGLDSNSGISKSTPWKRCPAMNGFSATYSHTPGDVYIFKGGVTWTKDALPMVIAYSGTLNNVDTYTTDHTWFNGSTWTQPTLDGQLDSLTLLSSFNASYFKINDIHFVNAGSLLANGVLGTNFSDCDNFELSNNTFAMESWGGLYIWTDQAKTFNNYLIHNNDISHTAFGVRIVPSGANSIIHNVQVYNNSLHDFHSQLSGAVHGDGIQSYVSPDVASSFDRYVDGFKIYNNRFTGDFTQVSGSGGAMTALIYLSSPSEGVEIYNNLFAPMTSGSQSPNFFESWISLRDNPNRGGHHKIYENTFITQVVDGQSAAILEDDIINHPTGNLSIKNNIFKNFKYVFDIRSTTDTIDYNDVNFVNAVGKYDSAGDWVNTFADWQAQGFDLHGISTDPLISTTTFNLLPGSPCINKGATFPDSFAVDLNGVLRPQGGFFDMGAFEYMPPVNIYRKVLPNSSVMVLKNKFRLYDLNGRIIEQN